MRWARSPPEFDSDATARVRIELEATVRYGRMSTASSFRRLDPYGVRARGRQGDRKLECHPRSAILGCRNADDRHRPAEEPGRCGELPGFDRATDVRAADRDAVEPEWRDDDGVERHAP